MGSIGWIVNPEDLTYELIDRLAQAGVNELGVHPGGGRAAGVLLEKTLEFHKSETAQALYAYAEQKGINVEYDAHVLMWLLPRDEFERHPEWFRMNSEGVRTPDMNMCASSEEALKLVSRRAYALAGLLAARESYGDAEQLSIFKEETALSALTGEL